jgi:glycerol-3-phosphate dehydrogenase
MTPSRARRKFPQLANSDIKYCPIFYEGQHDDARTNLAIAQTAAKEGAAIANYCEVTKLLREEDFAGKGLEAGKSPKNGKVTGATVKDVLTGKTFNVRAKTILFCGGPFTDELRKLEDPKSPDIVNGESATVYNLRDVGHDSPNVLYFVRVGAGGVHIVLPAYYAPASIGMVDMSTSDGRFLFFIPWEGHVLVGETHEI